MKKTILFYVFIVLTTITFSQTTAIPDSNFENKLIDLGIDTNGITGDILNSDAEAVTVLNVNDSNISDLQGIQAFVNVESLLCQGNQLQYIDVRYNVNLNAIDCENNQIRALDFTNNPNLQALALIGNQLQYLNLANGNNANILLLRASNNNLNCITVSDLAFATSHWFEGSHIDNGVTFSLDCGTSIIADINFENKLIDLGIDTNGLSGDILHADALSVTLLDANDSNISSLYGVEAFVNVENLLCQGNQLYHLDVHNNVNLTSIDCETNQIRSLDITNNPNILALALIGNQLEYLNLANGNNANILLLRASNNNLSCITVSDVDFAISHWFEGTHVDVGVTFSLDCNATASVSNFDSVNLKMYPNPVKDILTFESYKVINEVIIYDIQGRKIIKTTPINNQITMKHLNNGVYFVKIDGEIQSKKILKY